ncbi:MAG: chromosomal replication initiator protein DnaA [Planctomycetota bacterium]|jgi:chromosomal replication initiator protein
MTEPTQALWSKMHDHLRTHHVESCRHWFDEISLHQVEGGVVELVVPNDLRRRYLMRECQEHFHDAAQSVTGRLLSVHFVSPEEASSSRATPASQIAQHENGVVVESKPPSSQPRAHRSSLEVPSAPDELAVSPDHTFHNFVVGPNNRLAHAAAIATAENPGNAYNPLFIHGDVGLGKTHLLQAICQQIHEAQGGASILYISCDGFITRFMESVQAGQMSDFRHRYRDVDLLVIDDIHFLAKRDRTQEEFFHTFNSLYQSKRQIVLSSDAPPDQIPDLEDRLVSRFRWGLVAEIEPPDYETRVQIVKNKANVRGLDVPDDVACFIASHFDKNIRELEGALTKLMAISALEKVSLDLALAQRSLGVVTIPPSTRTHLTLERIVDTVVQYFQVPLTHLQSKKRHRSIALPRQICMYLARQHTRYSLEEVGGYFGGRDHTTVLHAVRTIATNMKGDEELQATINHLEQLLLSSSHTNTV